MRPLFFALLTPPGLPRCRRARQTQPPLPHRRRPRHPAGIVWGCGGDHAASRPPRCGGLRGYYAAVTLLDEQFGRLLDHLRAKGQLENTLVVFTSDHGYHLGWRGQWCKHSIDEQVLRVPLIVRHPQGAKGATAGDTAEYFNVITNPEYTPLVERLHRMLEAEFGRNSERWGRCRGRGGELRDGTGLGVAISSRPRTPQRASMTDPFGK